MLLDDGHGDGVDGDTQQTSKIIVDDLVSFRLVQGSRQVDRAEDSTNDRFTWVSYSGAFCSIRTRLDKQFFRKSLGGQRNGSLRAEGTVSVTRETDDSHVTHQVDFGVEILLRKRGLLPPFRGGHRKGYFFVPAFVLLFLLIVYACKIIACHRRSRFRRVYGRWQRRRRRRRTAKRAQAQAWATDRADTNTIADPHRDYEADIRSVADETENEDEDVPSLEDSAAASVAVSLGAFRCDPSTSLADFVDVHFLEDPELDNDENH